METNNIKLTDDEVVKAFECCYMGEACEECPLHERMNEDEPCLNGDIYALPRMFIEIYNRQKAENKRLLQKLQQAQAEAVKEFANELKCRTHEISYNTMQVVNKDDIDNLLKEMVGEDK